MNAEIALIGGSGVSDAALIENASTVSISTPFGPPSSPIVLGQVHGRACAFLARHGPGHRFPPSSVDYRANIYALKTLGVTTIIAISAVGSLKEEIKPLDIVIPDQIYDRTKLRSNTFFEDISVHVSFTDPFCADVSESLRQATQNVGGNPTLGGTYVCIEGPQFSTRAESNVYRRLGFDVIGMTAMPETKLAREAEICFGMLATVTDYDVWREQEVTIETVISNVKKNEENTRKIIKEVVPLLPESGEACECRHALRDAIVTSREVIPDAVKERLGPLIEKYVA